MRKSLTLFTAAILATALVSCETTKEEKTVTAEVKPVIVPKKLDLKENLVAEWKLAGDAKDSIGKNNGKATNVVFKKEGELTYGVFNGKSSVISVSPKKPLVTGKKFTVSAWIKKAPGNFDKQSAVIVGRSGYNNGWRLMMSDSQNARVAGRKNAIFQIGAKKGGRSCAGYRIKIEDDKWYHVIGLWDGIWMKVYVNAQLGHGGHYEGEYLLAKGLLGIGYNSGGVGHFNGCIGDVKIWNRALKRSEIKTVYQQGLDKLAGKKPLK